MRPASKLRSSPGTSHPLVRFARVDRQANPIRRSRNDNAPGTGGGRLIVVRSARHADRSSSEARHETFLESILNASCRPWRELMGAWRHPRSPARCATRSERSRYQDRTLPPLPVLSLLLTFRHADPARVRRDARTPSVPIVTPHRFPGVRVDSPGLVSIDLRRARRPAFPAEPVPGAENVMPFTVPGNRHPATAISASAEPPPRSDHRWGDPSAVEARS